MMKAVKHSQHNKNKSLTMKVINQLMLKIIVKLMNKKINKMILRVEKNKK